MAWLKVGDNATSHPKLLEASAKADKIEVFGFLVSLALHSAAHFTDYRFTMGAALDAAAGDRKRAQRLLRVCTAVGLVVRLEPGTYELIKDPEFLSVRLKAEVDWERQQGRDTANPTLTAPIRARDGDACRYCSTPVNFTARRGGRRGTYDHLVPGAAGTVETMVVACGQCNPGKRDGADGRAERYKLLPPPARPWFRPETVTWLAEHGYAVTSAEAIPTRTSPTPDDARPEDTAQQRPEDGNGARPDTAARSGDTAPHGATPGERAAVEDPAHHADTSSHARPEDTAQSSAKASEARSGDTAPHGATPGERASEAVGTPDGPVSALSRSHAEMTPHDVPGETPPGDAEGPPVSAETSPGNPDNPGRVGKGQARNGTRTGQEGPRAGSPPDTPGTPRKRGRRAPRGRGGDPQ